MSHWTFIVGAYAVTAILVVLEVLAVRARKRAACALVAQESKP
jgi:hypothetical protein